MTNKEQTNSDFENVYIKVATGAISFCLCIILTLSHYTRQLCGRASFTRDLNRGRPKPLPENMSAKRHARLIGQPRALLAGHVVQVLKLDVSVERSSLHCYAFFVLPGDGESRQLDHPTFTRREYYSKKLERLFDMRKDYVWLRGLVDAHLIHLL